MPLLRLQDVSKAFGGLRAVDHCSLDVGEGTITGLIGPNGAGKSTLFNVITGLYAPDAGEIWLRGRPGAEEPQRSRKTRRGRRRAADWTRIDGLPPHLVVRRGLVKTWQVPREFKNLPVLDNVILAAPVHPGEHLTNLLFNPFPAWRHEAGLETAARKVLETVGLASLAETPAGSLSGGQKKLLELGRALMTNPRLILLDEPMAGVNPVLAAKLMDVIATLRGQGHTFFLVEHDMDIVMSRCDWIVVMHEGRKIAEGRARTVREDPAVLESYLGG